jgi:hypothetical protein
MGNGLSRKTYDPDPPSRHHLPFDKLTVLSKIEGLMALRKVEGRRFLRSLLSFDLEALDRLTVYCSCSCFVSVMMGTEDGGRQTPLEDGVRETCSSFVSVISYLLFGM